ncbi:pyruvate kinase, partial [Chlamydia psittaci 06-1683]
AYRRVGSYSLETSSLCLWYRKRNFIKLR